MRSRISVEIGETIRRLAAEAARNSESSAIRQAAQATGALPVHADMGGALVVTAEGDVIQYDFETGATTRPDENWKVLGLAKAARRFPELRNLAPEKPTDAVRCRSCAGAGTMPGNTDCATCWGTGWIRK